MNEQALNYLGLARKGGNLETGDEPVRAAVRAGHAKLVLLAADAGEAVARKIRNLAAGSRQRVLTIPYDKLTLGAALGRQVVSVAAFADVSMALAFVKTLPAGTAPADLTEDLERRVARVKAKRKKA